MTVKRFIFNPLQENTYIVYDETNECVIIDPGCQTSTEKSVLKQFIDTNGLRPKAVWNTHCHFDHIFGNNFVTDEYGIDLWTAEGELANIRRFQASASLFGIVTDLPNAPSHFFEDGQQLKVGNLEWTVIVTPGHSPGSVCFYSESERVIFVGDTLFAGSIGRTDLPGGNYDEIKKSLAKLIELPDDTTVYCGHAANTTIGKERLSNPFITEIR
jgi:glyoxylase-like metal-dependent hydrolase (beta-lactamase superfamily II)